MIIRAMRLSRLLELLDFIRRNSAHASRSAHVSLLGSSGFKGHKGIRILVL